MTNLPEKFSAGIRVAVADLKACMADPKYIINMNRWHDPINGACHVCMAGAVISKTYNADPKVFEHIDDFNFRVKAFDDLRLGQCREAYYLYHYEDKDMSMLPVTFKEPVFRNILEDYLPYEIDPEKFIRWCLKVADIFEALGD